LLGLIAISRRSYNQLSALKLGERGKPKTIVSDNGTELTSNAILRWADDHKVAWHYIAPGKPVQTPSLSLFRSLAHTRAVLEAWRTDYNHERPHSRLSWMSPANRRPRRGCASGGHR
jgi:putative transposase